MLRLERPGWGPWITAGPETQLHQNIASIWIDETPVGPALQFAVGRRQLVVGWVFKRLRPVEFRTRGVKLFMRDRFDECDHDEES